MQTGADRDRIFGIDIGARSAREVLCDLITDVRDLGRAADEDHVVDLVDGQAGERQRLLAHRERAIDEIGDLADELVALDLDLEIERLTLRAVRDLVDPDDRARAPR